MQRQIGIAAGAVLPELFNQHQVAPGLVDLRIEQLQNVGDLLPIPGFSGELRSTGARDGVELRAPVIVGRASLGGDLSHLFEAETAGWDVPGSAPVRRR